MRRLCALAGVILSGCSLMAVLGIVFDLEAENSEVVWMVSVAAAALALLCYLASTVIALFKGFSIRRTVRLALTVAIIAAWFTFAHSYDITNILIWNALHLVYALTHLRWLFSWH